MNPTPHPVCPELVEGSFFFSALGQQKKRSFDKLRMNGFWVWTERSPARGEGLQGAANG